MIYTVGLRAVRKLASPNAGIRAINSAFSARSMYVPSRVQISCRTVISRAAKRLAEQKSTEGTSKQEVGASGQNKVQNPVDPHIISESKLPNTADPPSDAVSSPVSTESRAVSLFPKFMRGYANKITKAPVSHITAFLIVHELSAIVPLFGVWGLLYYFDYAPVGILPDWVVANGMGFIRRMAERNDWTMLANAETGSRLLLQGAAAYAIVKATLPLRLIFSLWAMPYFARWFILPINTRLAAIFKNLTKRSTKQ